MPRTVASLDDAARGGIHDEFVTPHGRLDLPPPAVDQITGVTWVDGELWHGTWEGDESDLRRVDPGTGEVLEILEMPPGAGVSGLESDGGDRFFCGGGGSGTLRAVRRPGASLRPERLGGRDRRGAPGGE